MVGYAYDLNGNVTTRGSDTYGWLRRGKPRDLRAGYYEQPLYDE
jgi:hypothetical protein